MFFNRQKIIREFILNLIVRIFINSALEFNALLPMYAEFLG